jgi:large subunit ribosomal protein L25
MPEQVPLQVEKRTVLGKKVRQLRRQGVLPANIFGGHRASIPIQLDAHELERMLKTYGHTTIFRVKVPGAAEDTVLIRHVQRAPTSGAIQHVDFLHVEMSQPIKARIPLHLTGEAPAVKLHGGILMRPVDALEVEALPADLPNALTVDVSVLAELNSTVTAGAVAVPPRVKLLANPDEPVVMIAVPRAAAAEAAAEAAVPPAAVAPTATETPAEE